MELHRTNAHADWYGIAPEDQTILQRLAARSHGIATLANGVSLLGASLAIAGLLLIYHERFASGLVLLGIGRLADILDGYLAHATRTKSSFGEAVDAATDKVVAVVAFAIFLLGDIVPVVLLLLLAVQNLMAMLLGLYAKAHQLALHPSALGKGGTAALWMGLMTYAASGLFAVGGGLQQLLAITGAVWLFAALVMGSVAVYRYWRVLHKLREGSGE